MELQATLKDEKRKFMEKRFYKKYQNNDRLEISFLAGLSIMAEDTTPNNPPNKEMKKDKNHFEGKRYNANLLTELQQRGFSEDV